MLIRWDSCFESVNTSLPLTSIHCMSHKLWGSASPSTVKILDSIQRRAVRLIDDPNLTRRLPSLAHRRAVGDLSLFYRNFHGLCSEELPSTLSPLDSPNRNTISTSQKNILLPSNSLLTGHRLSLVPLFQESLDCGITFRPMYFPLFRAFNPLNRVLIG